MKWAEMFMTVQFGNRLRSRGRVSVLLMGQVRVDTGEFPGFRMRYVEPLAIMGGAGKGIITNPRLLGGDVIFVTGKKKKKLVVRKK